MRNHPNHPTSILLVARYPRWTGFAGLLSMAIFRIPLWLNKKIRFWKLMGCGRNGSFDLQPDWRQWAILATLSPVGNQEHLANISCNELISCVFGKFVSHWLRLFGASLRLYQLQPEAGHGTWDGLQPFGSLDRKSTPAAGPIAVLTRATIRWKRLTAFWKHVDPVASKMSGFPGFVTSYGIGEAPFFRQATFSIWTSAESMRNFAYQLPEHREVIRKTNTEHWYSEEMFVRFSLLHIWNDGKTAAAINVPCTFG